MGVDPFLQYLQEIEPALSPERLSRYRGVASSDREVAVCYLWNIALSEALYPALNVLEISLRNSIHQAATNQFGTDFWFDKPGLLKKGQPDDITNAKLTLGRRKKPQTSGRIIAELSLGFWTTLLSGTYEMDVWRPNTYRTFKAAFPHLPYPSGKPRYGKQRRAVHQRYNDLRELRNRVFHYEPIWDFSDLLKQYNDMLDAIGWISPQLRITVQKQERFNHVLHHGWAETETVLDSWLNPPPSP